MILFLFLIINFSLINLKEEKDIFELNKNLRFCGADLMKKELKHYSTNRKGLRITSTSKLETITFRLIRIYLETTFFDSQNISPNINSQKPVLKKALQKAINGLSGLLEVEDIGDANIFSFIDPMEIFYNHNIYGWAPIFNSGSNI